MRSIFVMIVLAAVACGGSQKKTDTDTSTANAQEAEAEGVAKEEAGPKFLGKPASSPIPAGYHTVTPHLVVTKLDEAIAYYQKAFGAELVFQMNGPDGSPMHAEIKIDDSVVLLAPENAEMGTKAPVNLGGTAGGLHLYVENADAVAKAAAAAGGKITMPVADMFWGDRYGQVVDPFGHKWSIATHKEDLSPEEMTKRSEAFGAAMATGKKPPKWKKGKAAASFKPEGYFTVTTELVLSKDWEQALTFYQEALGAEVRSKIPMPDGSLMHAEIKVGDSIIMFSSEMPQMDQTSKSPKALGSTPVSMMVYVEDADAVFAKATAGGAKEKMPMMDTFWGDRWGQVIDPEGHEWGIATRKLEMTPEEMQENMKRQFAAGGPGK